MDKISDMSVKQKAVIGGAALLGAAALYYSWVPKVPISKVLEDANFKDENIVSF